MDIWLITGGEVERKAAEELDLLIAMQEGLVWVDIPTCDAEGARVLSEVFGFHPLAMREGAGRDGSLR